MAVSLEKFDALPQEKQDAFMALFSGGRRELMVFFGPNGERPCPHFGKAECDWIKDWQDFYTRELVELGWVNFVWETQLSSALGMSAGWQWRKATIEITELGNGIYDAEWDRFDEIVKREAEKYRATRLVP